MTGGHDHTGPGHRHAGHDVAGHSHSHELRGIRDVRILAVSLVLWTAIVTTGRLIAYEWF